ncbi:hypothetical protein K8R33_03385 [archaeon]|nr:hypothetical protein [archaeon]
MTITRTVKRAIDGDTLEVRNQIRGTRYIRLANVDAPEKGQRGYSAAKNKLQRLKGKRITIVPKGRSYNRVVAEVIYNKKR